MCVCVWYVCMLLTKQQFICVCVYVYVCVCVNHFAVHLKLTQHGKSTIPQWKKITSLSSTNMTYD